MPHAVVVDDDANTLDALAALIAREGFTTVKAASLEEARHAILDRKPDVIVSDLCLPDGQGSELLGEAQDDPATEVILITGQATVDSAVEALRLGAYDYLTKPVDLERLKRLLARLLRTLDLAEEVATLRTELRELGRFGPMIGASEPMQKLYDLIGRVAPTDASVLVTGESGSGKELVAQAIHQLSPRRHQPMLPINCGAISAQLIESELFGHERGSFTGASRQHRGYFERASGGTLFLDEITEMPVELQVKLLRVLETGQVRRVGAREPVAVDVRLIAATNRDPEEAVRDGRLREDLYYRLQVFPIQLPPLRRRGDDIQALAASFLADFNKSHETSKSFAPETLQHLSAYTWPGNVRELSNVVQRAAILADAVVSPDCLPAEVRGESRSVASGPILKVSVGESIAEVERRLILATLEELDGNKKKTAGVLGISLKTLYNRLSDYSDA